MQKDYLQKSGYKKSGKVYTPPILQLGEFTEIHWNNNILPELLWIGILQNKFGFNYGSNLVSGFTKVMLDLNLEKLKNKWLAPLSVYAKLSEQEKSLIVEKVKQTGNLEYYSEAFTLLTNFYPEFPLAFLVYHDSQNSSDGLATFKEYLSQLFDRTTTTTHLIQAVALDIAFQGNLLKVSPHTSLANFPAFTDYPHTEISQKVASGIRMAINQFFGENSQFYDKNEKWSEYFWNRGLQIENCYL